MADVKSSEDVVKFLKEQHETIRRLFAETLGASVKERREASFAELRKLLAVHETAEEMVVHPTARKEIPNGQAIVDARLNEENQAKQELSNIEKMDVMSDQFVTALTRLQQAVLEHAEHEEREEFDQLAREMKPEELQRMKTAVQASERIAPTHPHPGVESAAENLAVGPFASMMDRARDLIKQAVG